MSKRLFGTVLLGALLASSILADDFLARVSQRVLSDKSESVRVLSLDEMKEVKGGYRWVTGLVDISGLTHDNLGNIYGWFVARGVVYPDGQDMFWGKYYFEVEYYRAWANPRFSNYSETSYIFIPYDWETNLPYKTDSKGNPLGLRADDIYRIDPKLYYASRALREAGNAYERYQQRVIYRNQS